MSADVVNTFFSSAFKDINSANKSITLDIANRVYVDEQFKVKQSYKDDVSKKLGGDLARVKFAEPEKAAKEINEFVKKSTNGKIEDLIDGSALDPALTKLG